MDLDYKAGRDRFERAYLAGLYLKTEGRVNEAARLSGLSKVTLIERTKRLGVERLNVAQLRAIIEAGGAPTKAPQWHVVYIAGCAGESYHVTSFPQGDETCLALANQLAEGLDKVISSDDAISIFNDDELAEHVDHYGENYHG